MPCDVGQVANLPGQISNLPHDITSLRRYSPLQSAVVADLHAEAD
jgi:hypothetical protein